MRLTYLVVFLLSLAVLAPRAHAGGIQYAGGGTDALGRGGASAARADGPMVLSTNPAGLAELRGDQLMLNLDLALMDACMTATGYYGWGAGGAFGRAEFTDPETGESTTLDLGTYGAADDYHRDPYDKVCLDQQVTPIPQLAFSMRLSERLGIGFGLIFPAVTPQGTWGSPTGVIRGDTGELRPAPTRYMLVKSSNLGLFPTLGFGYRLFDALRVGAAFEWGMFAAGVSQMSTSQASSAPHLDILSRVSAEDFFVPAFNISAHLVPTDALDIVVGFRWQDDLDAEGRLNIDTGLFNPDLALYQNRNLKVTSVNQAFPWRLWAGVRFADRLRDRPKGTGHDEGENSPGAEPVHDAFGDEQWDIELDVVYEMNSRVKALDVDFVPNQAIEFQRTDGSFTDPTLFPAPETRPVYRPRGWNDQISLRAGGSYNFIPGLFGMSVGAHYENRGLDPSYMQLDFWPLQRIGLHAGLKVRIAGSVDVSLAYAHIFQETIQVGVPPHSAMPAGGTVNKSVGPAAGRFDPAPVIEETPTGQEEGVAAVTQTAARGEPNIVNAGKYESSLDIVSLGVQMHF